MLTHIVAFIETRDPEALHQFRIQVKRLKALLRYLQNAGKEAYKTGQLTTLQSIFKHAGRIRSAQNTMSLLQQYAVTDPLVERKLETIEKKETERFCRKGNGYIRSVKEVLERYGQGFQEIEDQQINRLYRKQWKKLTRFFKRPPWATGELHNARKRIKNLNYLYKVLPKKMTRPWKLDEAFLDQLQHSIGVYHDIVLLLEFLKKEGYAHEKQMRVIQREKDGLYRDIQRLSEGFERKVFR